MEKDNYRRNPSNNKILIGLLLITGGILLFINKAGVAILPDWFFTWPVLIIAVGFIVGLQHNFKTFGWVFLMAWGFYWLANQQMPTLHLDKYTAPIALVFVGLFFILHRKNKHNKWNAEQWRKFNEYKGYDNNFQQQTPPPYTSESFQNTEGEFIDITSVFSGSKKVVLSKNFKGGDITCFMGGAEIDLSQADIQGRAVIDITAVFGGAKIIVPSNWDVKLENTAAFGSIEDKRRVQNFNSDSSKVLVIEGTAVFGGIDITNY